MPNVTGFSAISELAEINPTEKIKGRIASGERGMIVWWKMKAGTHISAHRHDNEQIAWLMKGSMDFRLGDERKTCGAGDIVVIPGGVEHEVFFPEDTEVVDFFTPPRKDFLAGGRPEYMKTE